MKFPNIYEAPGLLGAVELDRQLCSTIDAPPGTFEPCVIYLDGRGMDFDFIAGTVTHHESRWVKLADGTMCNVTLERVEWQS